MKNRVLKIILSLCLIFAVIMTQIYPAFGVTKYLGITPVMQAKTYWCWAAGAEMGASYIYSGTKDRTQYDVVEHVKGTIFNKYPNEGGTMSESVDGSEFICYDNSYYDFAFTNAAFSFDTIKKHIDNGYPVQADISYYTNNTRTGGHRLVITGVNTTDVKVRYIDPWDATTAWVTYSNFKNGLLTSTSRYDGTVYFNGDLGIITSSENDADNYDTVEIKILKENDYISAKNYTGIVNIESLNVPNKEINMYEFDFLSSSIDIDNIQNIIVSSKSDIYKYTDEIAKNISVNNAFKLYDTDLDIVTSYKNNIPIDNIISSSYQWNIPITDINNIVSHVISLEKHNNKWEMNKIKECAKGNNILANYDYNKISEILKTQGIENAQNFKFINTGKYHTMLLYFTYNNKQYGLPFNTRPDLINLCNDTVYEMNDIINILESSFNY